MHIDIINEYVLEYHKPIFIIKVMIFYYMGVSGRDAAAWLY